MLLYELYDLPDYTRQGTVKSLETQVENLSCRLKTTSSELDSKSNSLRTLERKSIEVSLSCGFINPA